MNLKKVLSLKTVWVDLKAVTKDGIIDEMIDKLFVAGEITDKQAVKQAVLEREAKMSTGMQNGVAIPHGKTNSVDSLITAVGLQREGVDFKCLDGKPAYIFILTISPKDHIGPHIQFLAEISQIISQQKTRDRIIASQTHQEMYEILTGK